MGFKPEHAVVCLKEKIPEGVGETNFSGGKQIKNKYSTLKQAFAEASEDICWNILESYPYRITIIEFIQKMESNTIYHFEFQTWNLDCQPAYNRYKSTIQLL